MPDYRQRLAEPRYKQVYAGLPGPPGSPPTGAGYLADGDYGDVVVSGAGTAMAVDANAVGNTKLADVERAHVQYVLERTRWRVRGVGGAAEQLGLKPATLESLMRRLGVNRPGRA